MAGQPRLRSVHWQLPALLVLGVIVVCGCSQPTSNTGIPAGVGPGSHSFGEFFLEKGSDTDSTYLSFRGRRSGLDSLMLEMTTWGVIEYGLFLRRENSSRRVSYFLMGECGTVSSRTWKKVTLKGFLSPIEQDTLWILSFSNLKDTLTIGKMEIVSF